MKYAEIFIKCLKETCLEYKIDLESEFLFENIHYKKLKYKWIIHCPIEMGMTLDYFVEKYIISQEKINKMKKGTFDINVSVAPRKLSINALCREISKEEALMNGGDEENPEIIRQRFESDTGLKVQLKSKFDFDFDRFKDDVFRKLKLMKLVYMAHKQDSRLYDMLENPSLEGVDNTSINLKTVYGELISMLKSETAKEVDIHFIRRAKDITFKVGIEWEQIINVATIRLLQNGATEANKEINRINTYLKSVVTRLQDSKILGISYKHSLFETFYLKLLEYEQIGREYDLKIVNDYVINKEIITSEYIKKYILALNEYIKINDIVKYIKTNINKVSELVYMKNDASKSEKSFLLSKSTISQINNLIGMLNRNTKVYWREEIPLLIVISTLQEIKSAKVNKEIYQIKYYGYVKEHPALGAKLKQGEESREAYQILWIRKIYSRLYHNVGMYKEFDIRTSIEKSIDTIISCILQYHNIDDLECVHYFLIHQIDKLILHPSDYNIMIGQMEDELNKKCNCNLEVIPDAFNFFREIDRANLLEGTIKEIIQKIKQMKNDGELIRRFTIELEEVYDDIGTSREFILLYKVDLSKRLVILEFFVEKESVFKTYKKRLEELGMTKFFIS